MVIILLLLLSISTKHNKTLDRIRSPLFVNLKNFQKQLCTVVEFRHILYFLLGMSIEEFYDQRVCKRVDIRQFLMQTKWRHK